LTSSYSLSNVPPVMRMRIMAKGQGPRAKG
jgi:hypothetical protein